MSQEKRVKHLRQILLWPVYLLPLGEDAPVQDHSEHLEAPAPDNPWHEVDDEFGDPCEFQARHYNEFVTFLPPVQRFLYGQGLGRSVSKVYGESPIRVMRRTDVAEARVTLAKGDVPITLNVAHVDLYFFFDIDIAILALEVAADDLEFETAQNLMFRFGRAYPAYWEEHGGRGGHCPWKVEWVGRDGSVLAASDYENREKYLSFVCRHRAPTTAAHWEFLMSPMVLHHGDKKGVLRYRQLEYYRMPYMAYLALDRAETLSRSDSIRLALGNEAGDASALPYADSYLADFETRFCYDRNFASPGQKAANVRFLASGHTLVVTGDSEDAFFVSPNGGILSRFRHQHFLMFMIAHFQKAALNMFSDRLVAAVSRLDITSPKANRIFRKDIRAAHENFLRFAHRYWFHNISNHAQVRELFEMTRRHLQLDDLHGEVREELQDMGNFLEAEATRKQNETVVRLTVVTTFGLIGTVTTGFLGMNIIAWAEEPAWWRVVAFMVIFIPTTMLTLYTIIKSRRLSDFLDALSDEKVSWQRRWRALMRVWFGAPS